MNAMPSPTSPKPDRVLAVLADGPLLDMLRAALHEAPNAKSVPDLVAEAGDAASAITRAKQLRPDLALIDIEIGGLETARGIREQSSETRLVFLTGAVIGPAQASSGLADTYIYRDSPIATIVDAIRRVAADQSALLPPTSAAGRPPPLDLPLRRPSEDVLAEAPAEGSAPAAPIDRAAGVVSSIVVRLRESQLRFGLAGLVVAVGLSLLIAALVGAGGAALAVTGLALATLLAAAALSHDPLVRRALPALAAILFVIVALTWGTTGDRSFAADGLIPALMVLAGLGAIWYWGEQAPEPVSDAPPSSPPAAPELSDAGRPAP